MPIGRSTIAGSTGKADTKPARSKSAPTTGRMCSKGMCGSRKCLVHVRARDRFFAQEPLVTSHLAVAPSLEMDVSAFLPRLPPRREPCESTATDNAHSCPNLSPAAQRYLDRLSAWAWSDLFHHVFATLHDPAYREANSGALRMEWPRIPLPGWPDGEMDGATAALARSAARGRELADLLDPETLVPGVTQSPLRPEIAAIAVPDTTDGRNMTADDFAVTAGWGHLGTGSAVMPGQGRVVERALTPEERARMGDGVPRLGEKTCDVYLNDRAFWCNVPAAVWSYKLGGYQVLKKWLSYRERAILGRPLSDKEVQYFTDTARRIAAIVQLANA